MLSKGGGCKGSWLTSWALWGSLCSAVHYRGGNPYAGVSLGEHQSCLWEHCLLYWGEAVEHRLTSVLSCLAVYNTRIFLPQALEANAQLKTATTLCAGCWLWDNLKPCYTCSWFCSQGGLKEGRARLFTVLPGERMRSCEHELRHRWLPWSSGNTSSLCGLLSTGTGCQGDCEAFCAWKYSEAACTAFVWAGSLDQMTS